MSEDRVDVECVKDKDDSLKRALGNLSTADKFVLITFHDDQQQPIQIAVHSELGEESDTLKECVAISWQVWNKLEKERIKRKYETK